MIADLFVAAGILILAHGPAVAAVCLILLVTGFASIVAAHVWRRPKVTPAAVEVAVGTAVVGRPIRTHRRRSGVIVRHPKTGVTR